MTTTTRFKGEMTKLKMTITGRQRAGKCASPTWTDLAEDNIRTSNKSGSNSSQKRQKCTQIERRSYLIEPPTLTTTSFPTSGWDKCSNVQSLAGLCPRTVIDNSGGDRSVCSIVSRRLPEHRHRRHRHHDDQRFRYNITSNWLRTFVISVIVVFLSCTSSITLIHGQPPPLPPAGFLDFDNLPVTRFSCEGKVIGGYYADVETGCQMFHVCTLGQKDEIQDIKFLCLNGTVFDQETRVCERVDEVDCSKAEQFFDLNLDLYVPHATTQKPEEAADLEEEDDNIRPAAVATPKPKPATTTTTKPTTTTPTTTQSPRTRPPSTSVKSHPPIVSSSSQEEEDEEDGGNGFTAFNYYLKTPHSHVASGYNSQSRQSYIFNQPGPSSSSSVGRSSTSSSSSSTGRKVPSGQKTIVYASSSSTTSSSTQRPKTVVVVKATLPPPKTPINKLKTLPPSRVSSTTTPPPKFELVDDQYDEYYDDEDYSEQPPSAPSAPPSNKQSSYQHQQGVLHPHYANSKPSSSSGYDFRDGRSTKGVANAGSLVSSTTSKSSPASSKGRQAVSVAVSSSGGNKQHQALASKSPPSLPVKLISSEFINSNNGSTEEPYYYEDDYPDDVSLQQQLQGYSSSTSKSARPKSVTQLSTTPSSTKSQKGTAVAVSKVQSKDIGDSGSKQEQQSGDSSDYYDDDSENVNAHDHHFTHVDVPRIPFAKPNVPRVLVTNGKPFLPRLRRQSHHHHLNANNPFYFPQQTSSVRHNPHHLQQQQQHSFQPSGFLLPAASSSSPARRSINHHHHHPTYHPHQGQEYAPAHTSSYTKAVAPSSTDDLRREARAKARDWGRDAFR